MTHCGTRTEIGTYPEPGRSLSWFNLCVGCKMPRKVMRFRATWGKTKSRSQSDPKKLHFQKSQPALTWSPDSSVDPVCKQTVRIIVIYIPVIAYVTLSYQTICCSFSQTGGYAAAFPDIGLHNYKWQKDSGCPWVNFWKVYSTIKY